MFDLLGWIRNRVRDTTPEPPAEPDPAAERAVKLPAEEFQPDGSADGDRTG
jgi:hypothetical protein